MKEASMAQYPAMYNSTSAFSASFNYDLNGNMYDIERNDETGASTNYDISLNGNTNQLYQTSHSGNTYSYDYDEMGQLIREIHVGGSSTFEDVADSIFWTADGKIDFIADGTYMTYPGVAYSPDVIYPRKHYYYDGMGNRVAIVTEETSSVNGSEIFEQYCYEEGNPYVGCEECRMNVDYTIDTYFYEAGGKLLYKNKLINDWGIDIQCIPNTNDVEWYVYGSASDGRIATVYPRFKIQDNDFYDINFENDPPNNQVAYNTEMISNTFTANAGSASITGIETHRHLGEKRYEIKDHLGNVRATVSDIKNAENYNNPASSWKFLADVRSLGNYYPYGSAIGAGSWSGSSYNYGYNGMLKEGIGDDIYHTHFRNLSNGRWWSPDPKPNVSVSPYASMELNPIKFIDPLGDTIVVNGQGEITREDRDDEGNLIDNLVFYNNQGELEKIGELGKEINIDRILPQMKGKSAKDAKKLNIFDWKNKVKTNGEWDYKNSYKKANDKENTIFGLAWKLKKENRIDTKFSYFDFNFKMDAADFGNYMAGFTGRYANYGLGIQYDVLLLGAGLYQIKTDIEKNDYYKAMWGITVCSIFLFDEPDDFFWNINGMLDADKRKVYNLLK